ncbi:MAG: hypothetical protein WBW62_07290 [Solirubrobacterales bacterium]
MRETIKHLNRFLCGVLGLAVSAAVIAGCGGGEDSNQFADVPAGDYSVEVLNAEFPVKQVIARTYNLKLAVRNSGDETIPNIASTISLPDLGSTLAFAYRDPQKGLAQPQRPVWVLEEGFPKLAGTVGRGGAATSNRLTFAFGELPPGEVANMVWRVTAVRPGIYGLEYQLAAGLSGEANAVDAAGDTPVGLLPARISDRPILTQVDDKGNVVPLDKSERIRLKIQESQSE